MMEYVVNVLTPIRGATKELSASSSSLCDIIPVLTSTADAISKNDVRSSAKQLQNLLTANLTSRLSMLLNMNRTLSIFGVRSFSNVCANEFVVASYLNPRYLTAMHVCYGYSEVNIVKELSRLYDERFSGGSIDEVSTHGDDELLTTDGTASKKSALYSWVERFNSSQSEETRWSEKQDPIRTEYGEYFNEVRGKNFTAGESRAFWKEAMDKNRFTRLGKLARLFFSAPSLAIPQERHFSELKRRCNGLRTNTKVETLDRDAVVFGWLDD